ncbi:unnamed protein product [Owenia fusiformis]|uniref:Uncharacterized protein n=1 Tax=Owenia fusiformis TaxID=6347 RepID=A0A8J1UG15_OWEFU|nr:unnamed protein product [Owenia fusiformis]
MESTRKCACKNKRILAIIIVIIIFVNILASLHFKQPLRYEQQYQNRINQSRKQFLYLVQTEECLPDDLLQKPVLGDAYTADVLVLSFKGECQLENNTKHVMYSLYTYSQDNGSTWESGRNYLYTYAKEYLRPYTYYIFMDDDLDFLVTKSKFLQDELVQQVKTNVPILRQFEDFLLRSKPALSAPFRINYSPTDDPYDIRECCLGNYNFDALWNLPERVPMIRFDECFIAIHKDAIDYMMPMIRKYEHTDLWGSCKHFHMKAYFMFRRQMSRFTPMTVYNKRHKTNPQDTVTYADVISNILLETPNELRAKPIFLNAKRGLAKKYVQTYIMVDPRKPPFQLAPIKDPIAPWKYIDISENESR